MLTCWWCAGGSSAQVFGLIALGLIWVGMEVIVAGTTIGLAAARFFGAWYIGLPLGLLAGVHQLGGAPVTLLLLATIVVSDSSQYYSGRAFGRRPLAPAISPKKTVEGAIGGVICATAFLALVGPRVLEGRPALSFVPLGLVLVVLGIGGDLFESRLKRAAGVKDSSSLIPGHGGVLDRIDALLFVIPPFYLYLRGFAGL
jgi:phosphatidate cytidylyltransferase